MGDTSTNYVPTLEELGIDVTSLPEVPERYAAVVDYGDGEQVLIAARGVEVITITADAIDPFWLETREQVDEVDKAARQALALVTAGDHFGGYEQDELQGNLAYVITDALPDMLDEIEAWERLDEDDDLT
jgi:hypothetical protein